MSVLGDLLGQERPLGGQAQSGDNTGLRYDSPPMGRLEDAYRADILRAALMQRLANSGIPLFTALPQGRAPQLYMPDTTSWYAQPTRRPREPKQFVNPMMPMADVPEPPETRAELLSLLSSAAQQPTQPMVNNTAFRRTISRLAAMLSGQNL